jgi:hypothetical protein
LRICRTAHAASEPGFRRSGKYRFDSPDQAFRTLYAARDFKTCFFETVVRDQGLQIPRGEYEARSVVVLLLDTAALNLVPIHGTAAQQLGLNLAQVAGESYAFTQALSRAIHDHPDQPDGIVYRSRFDDGALAVVLFERGASRVRLFPETRAVALDTAHELTTALRQAVPFVLV